MVDVLVTMEVAIVLTCALRAPLHYIIKLYISNEIFNNEF